MLLNIVVKFSISPMIMQRAGAFDSMETRLKHSPILGGGILIYCLPYRRNSLATRIGEF